MQFSEAIQCLGKGREWPGPCLRDLQRKLSGPQAHLVSSGLSDLCKFFSPWAGEWFSTDPHRFLRLCQIFGGLDQARREFAVRRASQHQLFCKPGQQVLASPDDWTPISIPELAKDTAALGNLRSISQMQVLREYCGLNRYRKGA